MFARCCHKNHGSVLFTKYRGQGPAPLVLHQVFISEFCSFTNKPQVSLWGKNEKLKPFALTATWWPCETVLECLGRAGLKEQDIVLYRTICLKTGFISSLPFWTGRCWCWEVSTHGEGSTERQAMCFKGRSLWPLMLCWPLANGQLLEIKVLGWFCNSQNENA